MKQTLPTIVHMSHQKQIPVAFPLQQPTGFAWLRQLPDAAGLEIITISKL